MISDDSEHALMTLDALHRSAGDVAAFPGLLARGLRRWVLTLPAGLGRATLIASLRLCVGVSPGTSGVRSAGNGPAMRAPILGVATVHWPLEAVWELVDAATRITHTDARAVAGARLVALAGRFAAGAVGEGALAPAFIADAQRLVAAGCGDPDLAPLLDGVLALRTMAPWDPQAVRSALGCKGGVSGYMYHTVPAALLCWLRHPADFGAAVREAVSLGGDTDSIAAIVGALCGARVGCEGIPSAWLSGVADWPLTPAFARSLAQAAAGPLPHPAPRWPGYFSLLLRNLVFLFVVLAHVFRRMLPPY
jgi:ADP-ribosylglycohydrolase